MAKYKRQDMEDLQNLGQSTSQGETFFEAVDHAIKAAHDGLNGVLFAMSKKSSHSRFMFLFFMFVDFVQMLSFVLPPPEIMDFDYPGPVTQLARGIVYMQIGYQATRTFTVVPVLCVCLVVVVLELVNLFYVGYMWTNKDFKYIWTIQVLRHTMSSCVGILFIPFVGVMANVLTCRGIESETCLALRPITVIALIVFINISLLVSLTLFDPRPMSAAPSARPHARITTLHLCAKTVFALVFAIVQTQNPGIGLKTGWAFLTMAFSVFLAFLFCWYQPYFDQGVGMVRAVLSSILAWTASCTFLHVRLFYGDDSLLEGECAAQDLRFETTSVTTLFGGILLVIPLTHIVVHYRRQSLASKLPRQCSNVFELELKCRLEIQGVGRDKHFGVLSKADPQELQRRALRAHSWYIDAAAVFPSSSALCVFHAHLLLDFLRNRSPLVRRAILIAERRGLDIDLHFAIYKTKRLLEENLSASTDLLGYVKSAMYMKEAVGLDERCTSELVKFWDELQQAHPDVPKVRQLALSIAKLSSGARHAYMNLLHLTPHNPEILEKFGSFLIEVCSDYRSGLAILHRALRLSNAHRNRAQQENLDDINSESIGVIVMTASDTLGSNGTGTIVSANPMASQLLNAPGQFMVGDRFQDFCVEPLCSELTSIVQRFIERGDDSWFDRKVRTFLRTPMGEVLEVDMKLKPFASDGLHFEIYALFSPVQPVPSFHAPGSPSGSGSPQDLTSFMLVDPRSFSVVGLAGHVHTWFNGHPACASLHRRGHEAVDDCLQPRKCRLNDLVMNAADLEEAIATTRVPLQEVQRSRKPRLEDFTADADEGETQQSTMGQSAHGVKDKLGQSRSPEKWSAAQEQGRLQAVASGVFTLEGLVDELPDGSVGCLVMVSEDLEADEDLEDEDIDHIIDSHVHVTVERISRLGEEFVRVSVSQPEHFRQLQLELQQAEDRDEGMDVPDQAVGAADGESNLVSLVRRAQALQQRALSSNDGYASTSDGASSVYSAKSDTLRKRAQRVRLELANETKASGDASLKRVRRLYLATSLFLAIVAIYQLVNTRNVLEDFKDSLNGVQSLGYRKFHMTMIALAAQGLDMVRRGILSASLEQGFRADLLNSSAALKDVDAILFDQRTNVGGTLESLYQDATTAYADLSHGQLELSNNTLFEGVLGLSSAATTAANLALSEFDVSKSPAFALLANMDYFPHSLLQNLATSTRLYTMYVQEKLIEMEHKLLIESLTLGGVSFVLLMISLYPLLGNDERVERTKLGVLKVFLQMPRMAARDLMERFSRRMGEIHGGIEPAVNLVDAEDDDDGDDDDANREAGDAEEMNKEEKNAIPGAGGANQEETAFPQLGESRVTMLPTGTSLLKRSMTPHIERLRGELQVQRRRSWKRMLRILRMCVLLVFSVGFSLGMMEIVYTTQTRFSGFPSDTFMGVYRQVMARQVILKLRLYLSGALSDLPAGFSAIDFNTSKSAFATSALGLQNVHELMMFGSAEYGISGILTTNIALNDDIMRLYAQEGCYGWPATGVSRTEEDCKIFHNGVMKTGLHSALESFVDDCLSLSFDPELEDAPVKRDNASTQILFEREDVRMLEEFEREYLQVQLRRASEIRHTEHIAEVLGYERYMVILCLSFLALDLLSYLTVVGPSIRALETELSRAKQLILFVPEDVIPELPHVQRFFAEELRSLETGRAPRPNKKAKDSSKNPRHNQVAPQPNKKG